MLPQDFGFDLNEDSEDFEDSDTALDTMSQESFISQLSAYAKDASSVSYELLRKSGTLYCRANIGSQLVSGALNSSVRRTESAILFRLPWLK